MNERPPSPAADRVESISGSAPPPLPPISPTPHGGTEPPIHPGSCPRCGTATTTASAQGLCPRCLLEVGIGTQAGPEGGSGTPPKALDPTELAAHFPQLEILEPIGQGGMGMVYRARQRKLDRTAALKILPRDDGRDPAFAERFHREARALARLNHPNIITVYDFGEVDGLFYLVMEFVDGADLRRILQQGRLGPAEALRIVPIICDALQYAHANGVVHRDIKPGNILLDREGRVKIADFGIAKVATAPGDTEPITLTQARQSMGTPHYMAPEQVESPGSVDHRADIYSLGVVFYEMLTGELPIGRFAPPSRRVEIDVRLDEVVLRALEKEPDRRYQQVGEVKTEVERISSQPSPKAPVPPVSTGEPDGPSPRAHWATWLGAWAPILRYAALAWAALLPIHFLAYSMLGDHPVSRVIEGVAWLGAWAPFGTTVLGLHALLGDHALRSGFARVRQSVAVAFLLPALGLMALTSAVLTSAWIAGFRGRQQQMVALFIGALVLIFGSILAYRTVSALARRLTTPGARCRWWWFAGSPLVALVGLASALLLALVFGNAVRRAHAAPSATISDQPATGVPAAVGINPTTGLPVDPLSATTIDPNPIQTSTAKFWEMKDAIPSLSSPMALLLGGAESIQVDRVNAALRSAWAEYRACLQTNISVSTNAQEHLVLWSPPMPDAINRIEARFFDTVDPSLDLNQQTLVHLNLGPQLRGRWLGQGNFQGDDALFVWGDKGCVLEFWRVGQWYHWRAQHGYVTPEGLARQSDHSAPNQAPDLGSHEILVEIARSKTQAL